VAQHAAAAKAADRLRARVAVREREAEEVVRDIELAKVGTCCARCWWSASSLTHDTALP
jgi:hypothetical protein